MDATTPAQMRQSTQDSADIVIVGGGASGCVVASRLSEDPSLNVILIEAGRDLSEGATPADIRDVFPRAYANPSYFWPQLEAVPRKGVAPIPFSQARVLGGGSSVMGMWALRGLPGDYDAWRAAGAQGWGYSDVLPFFKKLERDLDFPAGDHGDKGPIPIIRRPRSNWPGFTEALARAAERSGYTFHQDLNGTEADGVFEMPFSTDGNTRSSSASAYLTAAIRRRANLKIVTDTEVIALKMDGRNVVGLDVRRPDGQIASVSAARVVLCAGAVYSPTLLLRSGIGPGHELAALGIRPIVDLPQVGRNLQNHLFIHLGAVIRPEARHDPAMRSYALGCVRGSSNQEGAPPSDLFFAFLSRSGPRDRDTNLGMIAVSLYSPFSRGSVSLKSKTDGPVIYLGFLEDARDRARLVTAARIARGLLEDEGVKAVTFESFLLPPKLPIRQLNQSGVKAGLLSLCVAGLLNSSSWLRRVAVRFGLGEGRTLAELTDEKIFEELVLSSATSMFHPAGTCALGTVVDSNTAVKGANGIFVADASIMPKVPRANTNIPTVMVAEKAASEISASVRRNPARG
jgi:5-(hydroxymethyl)furfural/furfural oxidase